MYRLEEKDLTAKLEILFKNNLYSLAINIVASLQSKAPTQSVLRESASTDNFAIIDDLSNSGDYDYGTIVEIYRRYGDWLYSKGDYDSAMQQYLRTIGRLEPSYVIRKFLDAQRIHNLTSYLQLLHEKGLGNSDHTTLLLNCYTKLRDVKKLDEFIKSNSSDSQEWTFDVHTAISVCRSAGYHQHALYLAKKYSQHEWVMKIQIEDLKEYTQTVDYLSKLPSAESERELKKYGYVLVTEMPVETTKIFVELCTRTSEPKFLESGDGAPISHDDDAPLSSSITSSSESEIYPEDLIPLYVHQPQWCIRFLEKILERKWGIVLASRDKGKVAAKNHSTSSSDVLSELSPRDQVSCTIACNTLLELYLSQLSSSENYGFSKEALVMELLKHPRVDKTHGWEEIGEV